MYCKYNTLFPKLFSENKDFLKKNKTAEYGLKYANNISGIPKLWEYLLLKIINLEIRKNFLIFAG